MAGIWPCFLDVSSPNLNGTAPFTPMHNLENSLRAHTHTSDYRPLREPRATPREVRASTTPTVVLYILPTVNQSKSSRSSASKLSQILDPSPLWKLPSPKEQIHKYKQVTIRHTMGTCRSIQSMLLYPSRVQCCKGTRFRVDFTQAEST